MTIRALVDGLFDDASVFPPGNLPLAEAVSAHQRHVRSDYSFLVGPIVLGARHLSELAALTRGDVDAPLPLVVSCRSAQVAAVLSEVREVPAVLLEGLEVALSSDEDVDEEIALVVGVVPAEVAVSVEVPRDTRRDRVVAALAHGGLPAKLRLGGLSADFFPDDAEVASTIVALAAAGVPFKATAGLHHAVRRTADDTGFEQHGFLNLLLAAEWAHRGASEESIQKLLAVREAPVVVEAVMDLTPAVPRQLRSIGTCSIVEPRNELIELGLLPDGDDS